MQFIRRTHLYIGLFLFPWAVLYGLTGFLFNHPGFLPDTPAEAYSRDDLAGTALEEWPRLEDQAVAIVAGLNEMKRPATPYKLAGSDVHYANRDVFNITVKADQKTIFVTFDPKSSSGVIREAASRPAPLQMAPFATGKPDSPRQRGMGGSTSGPHEHGGMKLADSMTERLKSGLPVLLQRLGYPNGEVSVTNGPDIRFPIEADGQVWKASFNPLTTSVSGILGTDRNELSLRTFLLRMHLTRGYPSELNTRWIWALGVDAIAISLCFWGISGVFMWWQIKSTRRAGLVILVLSTVIATSLGLGMHRLLTA